MTPCNTVGRETRDCVSRMADGLATPQIQVDKDESDVQISEQKGPLQIVMGTEGTMKLEREMETVSETTESTVRKKATIEAVASTTTWSLNASTFAGPQGQGANIDALQQPIVITVPPSEVALPKACPIGTTSIPTLAGLSAAPPPIPHDSALPPPTVATKSRVPPPVVQFEAPNAASLIDTTPRTMHIASSSLSPTPSSTGGEDAGKEESSEPEQHSDHSYAAAEHSRESGITPPLENTSISSDQVPSTVEVPAQPRMTMTRPSSKPHSLSMIHVELPQSLSVGILHPTPSHVQSSPSQKSNKSANSLRRGKWTIEEEAYVARVIQDFNSGYLNAPAGTTLRSYLSEKLHCDPMRITKKFTGDSCIGKRVFHPAVRCPSNTATIDKAQAELDALERRWRRRLEMQQRESAKKAAASAAAAAAAASGRSHFHTSSSQPAVVQPGAHGNPQHFQQNLVTRTASWLDRANAVLSTGQSGATQPMSQLQPPVDGSSDHAQAVRSLPPKDIEDQMKEVQRLIHEGPIIQQTTAGLPHLLDQQPPSGKDSPSRPPDDKRARRTSADETTGAADAEALVGFLNSVRAAAAAGQAN